MHGGASSEQTRMGSETRLSLPGTPFLDNFQIADHSGIAGGNRKTWVGLAQSRAPTSALTRRAPASFDYGTLADIASPMKIRLNITSDGINQREERQRDQVARAVGPSRVFSLGANPVS